MTQPGHGSTDPLASTVIVALEIHRSDAQILQQLARAQVEYAEKPETNGVDRPPNRRSEWLDLNRVIAFRDRGCTVECCVDGCDVGRIPPGATGVWVGYVCQVSTDHFTQGALLPALHRADQNESTVFPALMSRLFEVLGGTPTWLSTDRGPATRANYEFCTRAGVGLVASPRRDSPLVPTAPKGAKGHRLWDRHGQPLCPHCGGPTAHRGFDTAKGPRLRFECELKPYEECEKVKKISCSHDFRALIPHPRTSDAFVGMAIAHSPSEKTHQSLRDRYVILSKSLAARTRKVGLKWQRLRTAAAWLIEWLWLSRRLGWLDGYDRVVEDAKAPEEQRLKEAKGKHRRRLNAEEAKLRRSVAAKKAKSRGPGSGSSPPRPDEAAPA